MSPQHVDVGARNINSPELWIGFLAGVLLVLGFDLYLSARRGHGERFREAIGWSIFWIALSLVFGSWLWRRYDLVPLRCYRFQRRSI